MIDYRYGNDLSVPAVIELLNASTLGRRRPVDDPRIVEMMIRHGNLTVTAWDGDLMVGFARTLTDYDYVGYMSDLAVRREYQRRGIGIALIAKTREQMGPRSKIVLLAAPDAAGYYPRIGFQRHGSAWVLTTAGPFPGHDGTPA